MENRNELFDFPGGVCPSCEHSPLKVKVSVRENGSFYVKYYCLECGDNEFLPLSKNTDCTAGRNNKVQSEWARRVKERDGYACVICGSVNDLMAHHLISATDKPQWQDLLGNGITLCRRCHILLHDHTHPYPEKYKR